MKHECKCVFCGVEFISQWRLQTCDSWLCKNRLGATSEEIFFFDRIAKQHNGCWSWVGGCDKKGNPVVNGPGKGVAAWKFSFRLFRGIEIGTKYYTRSCGNKACVNHAHFHDERDRLLSRLVKKENGCIEWSAARDKSGYAIGWLNGRQGRITRMLWEMERGKIPEGLIVCHKCDNPPCCNLDHLFIGSHKANSDDKRSKSREARGEQVMKGVLTDEAVLLCRRLRRGGLSYPKIIETIGIDCSCHAVASAATGKTWSHLNCIEPPAI